MREASSPPQFFSSLLSGSRRNCRVCLETCWQEHEAQKCCCVNELRWRLAAGEEIISDPGESLEEAKKRQAGRQTDTHAVRQTGRKTGRQKLPGCGRSFSHQGASDSINQATSRRKVISDSSSQLVKSSRFSIGVALGGRSLAAAIPEPISSASGKINQFFAFLPVNETRKFFSSAVGTQERKMTGKKIGFRNQLRPPDSSQLSHW